MAWPSALAAMPATARVAATADTRDLADARGMRVHLCRGPHQRGWCGRPTNAVNGRVASAADVPSAACGGPVLTSSDMRRGSHVVDDGPVPSVIVRLLVAVSLVIGSPVAGFVSPTPGPSAAPSVTPAAFPADGTATPPPSASPAGYVLAPPLDASDPPAYRPSGPPTVSTRRHGVLLELWVADTTLDQGQWLQAHVRVTNLRRTPIARYCTGIVWTQDTGSVFDAGRTWSGIAGTFKERWLAANDFVRLIDAHSDLRPRREGCGDEGQTFRQPPGGVVEETVVGLPRYEKADQPLPGGAFTIGVDFSPGTRRDPDSWAVSVPMTLAGGPVGYPTPGSLVDVALGDPAFLAFLARKADTHGGWDNLNSILWQPPYPELLGMASPDVPARGILEIGMLTDDSDPPDGGWVRIDPWTGTTYGFYSQ